MKISTAEEFLKDECSVFNDPDEGFEVVVYEHAIEALIDFAKLHVKAALQSVSNTLSEKDITMNNGSYGVRKESILSAYPLENIK